MSAHQYEKSSEGLKDLTEAYNYWTGKVSESSVTLSLALIAANWAIFGQEGLRTLSLPRWSVAMALFTLLVSTGTALWMACLHDKRHEFAETKKEKWEAEFQKAKGDVGPNPWPYTKAIELVGYWTRIAKFVFPVIAGVLFIFSFDSARDLTSTPKASSCEMTSK